MNEVIEKDKIIIENMIYEIRGKQVMLDSDLAKLFGVETKRINEAVKNNPKKFPERYAWILTKEETILCSRSKFSTLNENKIKRGQNLKYLPYVFTEHGVMILSSLLKSDVAARVNVRIIKAFVAMRDLINNGSFESRLNNVEQKFISLDRQQRENEQKFDELFSKFKSVKNNYLFFEGQIYDSYSLLIDILNSATKNVILIDNYIDKKILYHSRASFKDLGKKCFAL